MIKKKTFPANFCTPNKENIRETKITVKDLIFEDLVESLQTIILTIHKIRNNIRWELPY